MDNWEQYAPTNLDETILPSWMKADLKRVVGEISKTEHGREPEDDEMTSALRFFPDAREMISSVVKDFQ